LQRDCSALPSIPPFRLGLDQIAAYDEYAEGRSDRRLSRVFADQSANLADLRWL